MLLNIDYFSDCLIRLNKRGLAQEKCWSSLIKKCKISRKKLYMIDLQQTHNCCTHRL